MSKSVAIVVLASLLGSGAERRTDDLCLHLDRFEREVSTSSAKSGWIKVTWDWGNWTVACAHDQQPGAKELCSWLPHNMSWEFPGILAQRVFDCYRVAEHPFKAGRFETADRTIQTKAKNRLHIQTGDPENSPDELPWMRLTVEATK